MRKKKVLKSTQKKGSIHRCKKGKEGGRTIKEKGMAKIPLAKKKKASNRRTREEEGKV